MALQVRAVLALVLLVLFPVVVLGAALTILIGGAALGAATTTLIGGKVAILAVPLLWALTAAVRDGLRAGAKAEPLPGPELSRAEHPALWAELDDLARRMRQQPVDRVVVLPQVNAFVTEAAKRRELMIGLPLLAGLDRGQMRAVLAHELGHFSAGHTRAGARAYRAEAVLRRTHGRLTNGVMRKAVEFYHRCYLMVSMPVLREHEHQADVWSARLAGSGVAASVFPTLARLDLAWGHLSSTYLPLARGRGDVRASATEGLLRLLDSGREDLELATQEVLAAPGQRFDTHPSAAERMDRLRAAGSEVEVPGGREPAWRLLGGGEDGLLALEQALGGGDGTVGRWDEAVSGALLSMAGRRAAVLADQLAEQVPRAPRTPAAVLEAVAEGRGAALAAPLLRGDIPQDEREAVTQAVLGELLGELVLSTLARQGRAEVTANWTGPADVVVISGHGVRAPWDFDPAVAAAAADPAAVHPLAARLVGLGADLDLEIEPTEDDGVPLRSAAVAALGAVSPRPRPEGMRRRAAVDVVIYDDGVLVHPTPAAVTGFGERLRRRTHLPSRFGQARLVALAEEVQGDPAAWAVTQGGSTRWIPFTTLTGWRYRETVLSDRKLRLTAADGSEITFKHAELTVTVGEIGTVLTRALGEPES